jgi:phage-related protein
MADYTISLEIIGKDDASPALGKVHSSLTGIGGIASSALGAVGNGLKIIAGISLAGAVAGVGALVGGLVSCAKAAMDAETISAELTSVIKSTGGAAGVTADMANDLALALSKVTRFEDDSIVQGESMLLTFTNIGKDVFPMATEAMLNMAQKFGSMDAASVQLGKALNDPIVGVSALRRVGVMLTDAQEKQIKQFMAVGDIASAQKVILKELGTEFGGLARAAGQTLAGKLDILKNSFGNVQETIGGAIIPLLTTLLDRVIMPLLPMIEKFSTGFADVVSGFAGLFSKKGDLEALGAASLQLTDGLYGIAKAFGLSDTESEIFSQNIADLLDKLAAGDIGGLATALGIPPEVQKTIENIIGAVERLFAATSKGGIGGLATALGIPPEVQNTITNIIGTIERLFAATAKGGAGGLMEALNLPPGIVDAINQVLWSAILLGDWIQKNLPIAQAAFQTAWKVIGDVVMTIVDIFKADVLPALQEAFQNISDAMAELGIDWGDVWGAIGTALKVAGIVIGAVLLFIVGLIVGFAKAWASTVKSTTKTIKEMVVNFKGMVEGIAKLFAGFMEVVKGIFSGDLPRVFRGVKSEIEGLVQFAGSMFKQMATVIKGFLAAIVGFVGEFVDGVVKFFKDLYNKLVGGSIVPEMMAEIKKVITDVLNDVRDFIQSILNTIAGIFQSVFSRLVDIVSSALMAVQNAVTAGLNAIRSLFETGFANLVNIVSAAWTAILNGIATAWQAITDAINWAIQAIPAAVAQAIQGLVAIGASIVATIARGITNAWNAAAGVVKNLYDLLMNLIGDVWKGDLPETIMAFGKTILNAISSGFTAAWNAVGGFVDAIKGLLADLGRALSGLNLASVGNSIINAIIAGIEFYWDNFVNWLLNAIKGIFSGTNASSIAQGITNALNAAASTMPIAKQIAISPILAGWQEFVATLKGFLDAIGAAVSVIVTPILAGWQEFVATLKGLLDAIGAAVSVIVTPILAPGAAEAFAASIQGAMQPALAIAIPVQGLGAMGAAMGNQYSTASSVTNNYNLYVTTTAPVENIVADFGMLDALAGVV